MKLVSVNTGPNIAKLQKSRFKICHKIVKKRYAQNDPGRVCCR
jgi:hypothetical protein